MRVRLSARYATDDDVAHDLLRVAEELGHGSLTREEYERFGQYHPTTIHRRLGGWTEAIGRAGLKSGRPDLGHDDTEWMTNIFEVWTTLGRQPSYGDMRGTRHTPEGYAKRFGSWGKALLKFQGWADSADDAVVVPPTTEVVKGHTTGRSPSLRLRWEVLQRDGFTCVSCGRSPATEVGVVLHIDHEVPYSKGGETLPENLRVLCDRCNLGKSDR
ncbi:hypothetical protein GCM10027022_17350 [Alpinimonas psychrophila]